MSAIKELLLNFGLELKKLRDESRACFHVAQCGTKKILTEGKGGEGRMGIQVG